MGFLDKARAYPPRIQLALALVVGLGIGVLLLAIYWLNRPDYEVLFSDLRPADAATIIEELDRQSTPYRLAHGGTTILTPAALTDRTRISVMSTDLPLKGTVGFELFNKSDLGLTEFAQRINYQRALQGELARTIMTISGIEHARVHLTLPKPSIFRDDQEPTKASVTLLTRHDTLLAPGAIAGIRRLVAASVSGLAIEDVVVIDHTGTEVGTAVTVGPTEPDTPPRSDILLLRSIEDYYSAFFTNVLQVHYPDIRVLARIPQDQWAAGDSGRPDAARLARTEALANWQPHDRAFRMNLTIVSDTELDASMRDDLALIVTGLPAWHTAMGDRLEFSLSSPAPSPPETVALPPPPHDTPTATQDTRVSSWSYPGLLAISLCLLLVIIVWARRRIAHTGRLTTAQKEARALKIRRLLEEQERDEA